MGKELVTDISFELFLDKFKKHVYNWNNPKGEPPAGVIEIQGINRIETASTEDIEEWFV